MPRSARAGGAWRGSSSRRASCSPSPAAPSACCSRGRCPRAGVDGARGAAAPSRDQIDTTVLLFALVVSLVAGLLFGIIPVTKYATPHLAGALKEGGRLSSAGRARHRARNTLVVAEIALAVVLLVAAGLMIRTFQAMRHVEPRVREPRRGAHAPRVDPVIAGVRP